MSKFINEVKSHLLGSKRKVIYEPLDVKLSIESPTYSDPSYQNHYRASVEWGCEFFCMHKDMNPMIDNVCRELREVVYGELKSYLHLLERYIYERKEEEALMVIRDIIREIHGGG
jgi:hypothetical protein